MNKDNQIIKDARKKISFLVYKVLAKTLCVREAIKQFPEDIFDESIQCVCHALVHYEADEDYRMADPAYELEQDLYLEMIAEIMQKGDPLPANIIQRYRDWYDMAPAPYSSSVIGKLKSIFRLII